MLHRNAGSCLHGFHHFIIMVRLLIILVLLNSCQSQMVRKYYLAAEDIEWDYAPTNMNVITGIEVQEGSIEGEYLLNGPNRIGSKYTKAVFVEYTDETFTETIPKSDWQGILGPIIRGEVGDTLEVMFKNLASRPYSLHTHGMLYDKMSEGAKYNDDTPAKDRLDDSVPPGSNHTYIWRVDDISGPEGGDPGCIAWPYHTHIETPFGTNTGLIGASIICKPGTLDANGKRTDVDKDFVLLVTVIDENISYYIDKNIRDYCGDPNSVDPEDEDFVVSNEMHSINGYVYGNLPGLEMCEGDRVAWHVFSMGTETDLHTLYFHGNSLNIRGHRRDAFSTSPAYFLNGDMHAMNPGTWLMTSEVNVHMLAGTQALYEVIDAAECSNHGYAEQETTTSAIRQYYIQAEEDLWDYAPSGVDEFNGISLTDPNSPAYPFFANNTERIGGIYKKARYIQYTDGNFSTRVEERVEDQHLGFLGPVIRAEVFDKIMVTFRNGASRNYSILPHGVMYNKSNEGSAYSDGTSGLEKEDDAIPPGSEFTYHWTVPEHYGPIDQDEDCITWLYYSAVDAERDVYSGLVGPLLVCRPGTLDDDGKRTDVFEFHILMMTVDENRSWYIEDNIEMFTDLDPEEALNDDAFKESNMMEAINGYSFANLPGLNDICQGRDVNWHMSTLGGDTDQHTIYFRGNTVTQDNRRTDTVSLTPGNSVTSRMAPKNKGIWEIECMTGSHFVNGMKALYTVHSACTQSIEENEPKGIQRTYHIGTTEINWDFAANKIDPVRNQSLLDEDSPGNIFVKQEGPFIGSIYKKAVYRQYTDETFMDLVSRSPSEEHLSILGPMIHAEVGDQIKVIFKNLATREYSMHPHGVMYNKSSQDTRDHIVKPGEVYTYTWDVPAEAGPSDGDSDCILFAYYSDADRVKDTHSGLIGPLIICRKGTLGTGGRRIDVDREFVLLFSVFDENQSWYLDDNIKEFSPNPELVDKEDEEFQESNLMHGMNGRLYGNLKHLEMYLGETVEWYLIGVGDEVDIHTVHFHGQPVVYQQWTKHRVDVVELFPGVFSTVQMKVKEVGTWLLHCHVNDHILGGMEAVYNAMDFKGSSTTNQPIETTTPIEDPVKTSEMTTAGYAPTGYCITLLITNLAIAIFNYYEYVEYYL